MMSSSRKYSTTPDPGQTGYPGGVRYIIGNEGCERFSFYGMKSILQVHITGLFVAQSVGQAEQNAQEMVHLFVAGVYAFPMLGAIISDRLLGKYRTILWLSGIYCLGHFVLAIAENSIQGMWIGLGLIAIGSGGIKPCVSAHVGDQFGKGNWHYLAKVFQGFYFVINFGSFFATLLIPYIRVWEQRHLDWSFDVGGYEFHTSIAFGLPGLLMLIATVLFWMGRHQFVHVPPQPGGRLGLLDVINSSLLFTGLIAFPMFCWGVPYLSTFTFWSILAVSVTAGLSLFLWRQRIEQDDGFLAILSHAALSWSKGQTTIARRRLPPDIASTSIRNHWFFAASVEKFGEQKTAGPLAVIRVVSVFLLVSVFWALFDQHASSWVRQAQQMELNVILFSYHGKLLPSQISALNPLMVMALIPLNNFVFYPCAERCGVVLTPLRKMTLGMFIASLAFVVVALLQTWIDTAASENVKISVLWQFFPYLIMTQSEVMVSITGLEFAYTQAPRRMKSTVMGFWLLSVALGNKLVAVITRINDLELNQSFWLFAGLMALAALLFGVRASFYTYRDFMQSHSVAPGQESP